MTLISRADAIEAVIEAVDELDGGYNLTREGVIRKALSALPSAEAVQIKQTDTLIIADALRYLAKDAERHPSDRARAEALREQILQYGASMCHAEAIQGEWIGVTNGRGGHECSNCHAYAPSYMSGDEYLSDFCPNCGARMKGCEDK